MKKDDFAYICIHELTSRLMHLKPNFKNITWCQKWDANE